MGGFVGNGEGKRVGEGVGTLETGSKVLWWSDLHCQALGAAQ